MKRGIFAAFLMMFVLVLSGCGPSLKEYVSQCNNYYSKISSTTSVSVVIEARNVVPEGRGIFGAIGAAVNTASAVGAIAVSSDQQKRLVNLINTNQIVSLVAQGFDAGFVGSTHLVAVDANSNPDLRISLKVRKFGIWAESLLDPMNFYVEADIQIVHSASMETIYSNGATIMREASSIFANVASIAGSTATDAAYIGGGYKAGTIAADSTRMISGAANMTAFFKLTDEEVAAIFDYMAYDAGITLAERLTNAIYH